MNFEHYLFVFENDYFYDMPNAVSFRDALWEMAKQTEDATETLRKSLKGYDSDDIDGMITLFNALAYTPIRYAVKVEKVMWTSDKEV